MFENRVADLVDAHIPPEGYLTEHDIEDILEVVNNNFLKFSYIRNTGASFGIFSGNTIFIIILSLIIIAYIIYELIKHSNNMLYKVTCILILGGAFGNLIDRLFRGYVVDFISFTLFNKEMAIFNVADIFVTFGVLLYIYIILIEGAVWKK